VGEGAGVSEVVHRNELDTSALLMGGAQDAAADAAETVDGNAHGHDYFLPKRDGAPGRVTRAARPTGPLDTL